VPVINLDEDEDVIMSTEQPTLSDPTGDDDVVEVGAPGPANAGRNKSTQVRVIPEVADLDARKGWGGAPDSFSTKNGHPDQCISCLSEFEDQAVVCAYLCGHVVHKSCEQSWAEARHDQGHHDHTHCPVKCVNRPLAPQDPRMHRIHATFLAYRKGFLYRQLHLREADQPSTKMKR